VSRLVEVPLAGGGSILVEVDGPVQGGPVVRGRGGGPALPPVEEPLERLLDGLGPVTRAVLVQLRQLAEAPEAIEVEFGVKLSADARMVIARAGGEANFRIALRWSRDAGAGDG
jgi:hypothetical protein